VAPNSDKRNLIVVFRNASLAPRLTNNPDLSGRVPDLHQIINLASHCHDRVRPGPRQSSNAQFRHLTHNNAASFRHIPDGLGRGHVEVRKIPACRIRTPGIATHRPPLTEGQTGLRPIVSVSPTDTPPGRSPPRAISAAQRFTGGPLSTTGHWHRSTRHGHDGCRIHKAAGCHTLTPMSAADRRRAGQSGVSPIRSRCHDQNHASGRGRRNRAQTITGRRLRRPRRHRNILRFSRNFICRFARHIQRATSTTERRPVSYAPTASSPARTASSAMENGPLCQKSEVSAMRGN